MDIHELKQQLKEKGSKSLCKEKIKKSKAIKKSCEPISFSVSKGVNHTKENNTDTGELQVEVIANMSMFIDHDKDVLSPNSWVKSIAERGSGDIIPFLHDHIHTTTGLIGKTIDFSSKDIDLMQFGYEGTGVGLVHKALVMRDYNESIYAKYKKGSIKQHSIGLQYVGLELAVNDPDYDEYKIWKANIENIINKEVAEQHGYFWWVTEIKLIENSAVLFPSNTLTPTISVQSLSNTEAVSNSKSFYKSLIQKG